LHDPLWLSLADLGVAAVKKNSFLLHYVNSTIEKMIEVHFWLLRAIDAAEIEATGLEPVREQMLLPPEMRQTVKTLFAVR
jgi:hypothetical protein